MNTTQKSGPDVIVSRVVDISTPPPPPPRRPEMPPIGDLAPPRSPQATMDWTSDVPVPKTDTKPNLGTQAAAALAAIPDLKPQKEEEPPPSVAAKRPAAPQLGPTSDKGPWALESTESLLDELDAGFDSILGDDGPKTSRDDGGVSPAAFSKSGSGGMSGARELFADLAKGHVRHVRDFMIDVGANQAKTEWVSVCEPAIQSVREMAEQLAMTDLVASLEVFGSALAGASAQLKPVVEGAARQKLIDAYAKLIEAMPGAFALDSVRSAREAVIVQSLLLQISDVRKVALDRLYKAGLTSLDVYYVAKPEEIVVTTGLSIEVAQKIVAKFKQYKKQIEGASVDAERSFEHKRLEELAMDLARHHRTVETADDNKEKREARKAREETLLEIKVLLARLGETDRLAAMDKLPFADKARELGKYLEKVKG
jgi:hypothetical protein